MLTSVTNRPESRMNRKKTVKSLLTTLLLSAAVHAWAAEPVITASADPERAGVPTVGVFSGEFVDGVPVYLLPRLVVATSRKAGLAKLEGKEHLARTKQAPPTKKAGPPV